MDTGYYLTTVSVNAMAAFIFCFTITLYIISLKGFGGGRALISVRDNGKGIPQKVLDKIFQPFFTTKPTGQGTGLGLSLSYDIIKAQGGEITMENKEGEGTTFIVLIPIA